MAFSSTTVQPSAPAQQPKNGNDIAGPLMAALILGAFAANKSRRHLRALHRKATWNLMKYRFNSLFKKSAANAISTRTILIIILAVIALILVFSQPWIALGILLVGLLLILLLKF